MVLIGFEPVISRKNNILCLRNNVLIFQIVDWLNGLDNQCLSHCNENQVQDYGCFPLD